MILLSVSRGGALPRGGVVALPPSWAPRHAGRLLPATSSYGARLSVRAGWPMWAMTGMVSTRLLEPLTQGLAPARHDVVIVYARDATTIHAAPGGGSARGRATPACRPDARTAPVVGLLLGLCRSDSKWRTVVHPAQSFAAISIASAATPSASVRTAARLPRARRRTVPRRTNASAVLAFMVNTPGTIDLSPAASAADASFLARPSRRSSRRSPMPARTSRRWIPASRSGKRGRRRARAARRAGDSGGCVQRADLARFRGGHGDNGMTGLARLTFVRKPRRHRRR